MTAFRTPALLLLPLAALLPPVDAFFSTTMARKALMLPLLLLLCGWTVSRFLPRRRSPAVAPACVAAAALLLLFWMIPRSTDLTQIYASANMTYVSSIFVAGCLLARFVPQLSGVARAACQIYFSSMLVAFGLLYAFQSTLLCSAFTLQDQHTFGRLLVSLGLFMYLWVLVSISRWLVPGAPKRSGQIPPPPAVRQRGARLV